MKRRALIVLAAVAVLIGAPAAAHAGTLGDPALTAANVNWNAENGSVIWTWEEAGMDLHDMYYWAYQDWNNTYGPTCGNGAYPTQYRADMWTSPSPGKTIPRNTFATAYGCAILYQSTTWWPDYQYAMQYGGGTDWTWTRSWHNANWFRRMMCRIVYHEMGHTVGHGHNSGAFGDMMRPYITQSHTPSKCLNRWP